MTAETLLIVAGALVGGFVNGLTGFGTALSAMPFWLHAVPPVVAGQLAAAGGVVGQLQTLPAIWHAVRWRDIAPYVVAGLVGVPLGVMAVPHVSPRAFKLGVGVVLVVYCSFMLLDRGRLRIRAGGQAADAVAGFVGGVLGGIAGLSGPMPTVWTGLRGLEKDTRRAVMQSFNMTILAAMLAVSALNGLVGQAFLAAFVMALPATMIGAFAGQRVYRRLDQQRFDGLVLALLLASGLALIGSNYRA